MARNCSSCWGDNCRGFANARSLRLLRCSYRLSDISRRLPNTMANNGGMTHSKMSIHQRNLVTLSRESHHSHIHVPHKRILLAINVPYALETCNTIRVKRDRSTILISYEIF
jgi:hypothetical protein